MFKRHVYTCPDVIYIRNRNQKINLAANGVALVVMGGLWLYGRRLEKNIDKDIERLNQEMS